MSGKKSPPCTPIDTDGEALSRKPAVDTIRLRTNGSFGGVNSPLEGSLNSSMRRGHKKRQVVDDSALTGAVALGGMSLATHVVVDAFGRPGSTEFPDVPLLLVGAILMAVAAPLAHCAGKWTIPGYDLWQPFKGGDTFIILQMLGWLFYSTWLMITLIVLANRLRSLGTSNDVAFGYGNGVLSFMGFLGFVSIILVVNSPGYYKPTEVWQLPFGRVLKKRTESLFAVCLVFVAFTMTLVVDFLFTPSLRVTYGSQLHTFSIIGFAIGTLVTHCMSGPRSHHPHYRMWQPFQGGVKFVLLQGIGWGGFSTATYICLNWDLMDAPQGTPSLIAWLFMLSFLTLLYSIEEFEYNTPVLMKWTGERLVTFMLSVVAMSLFILIEVMALTHGSTPPPIPYVNLARVAGLVQFSLPIVTQYLATRQHRGYSFFQPFIGGAKFVSIQALGWTLYTTTLIVWILYIFNASTTAWKHIFAVGIFGFVSELCILVSPNYFESDTVPTEPNQTLMGELIVSTLLAMGGASLFYIVDLIEESHSPFPRQQVLAIGVICLLIAPVLAHVCGQRAHESYHAIQPFEGGAEFVALQSIAWTIYAVMLVFYSILLLNFGALEGTLLKPWLSICGVIGVLPWGLILLSIRFYQEKEDSDVGDVQVSLRFKKEYEHSVEVAQDISSLIDQTTNPQLREMLSKMQSQYMQHLVSTQKSPRALHDDDAHPVTTLVATGLAVLSFFLCLVADIFVAVAADEFLHVVSVVYVPAVVLMALPPILVHCRTGPSRFNHYRLWQPFRGGFNFVLLQTIGWCLFSVATAGNTVILFGSLHHSKMRVIGVHSLLGLFGAASYCVILLSLSLFQDDKDAVTHCGQDSFLQRNAEWTVSLLMTCGSSGLFMAVESVRNKWGDLFSVAPIIFLAGLAIFASIPLVYIAVRKSRKLRKPNEDLKGGDTGMELFGWAMYGLQATMAVTLAYQCLIHVIPVDLFRTLAVLATLVSLGGQVGFYLIIFWNEGRTLSNAARGAVHEVVANVVTMGIYVLPIAIYIVWVLMCFHLRSSVGSAYFFFYMHAVTFSFMQPAAMALVRAACVLGVVYGGYCAWQHRDFETLAWTFAALLYTTSYNDDYRTGARASPHLNRLSWLWELIGTYFRYRVIEDVPPRGTPLKNELMSVGGPLLFSFHPHGIYPFTCIWGTLHPTWQAKVGVQPSVHAASIIFGPPMMREMAMTIGARDVSRQSLDLQLGRGEAAMLVPGGQAEMRESSSTSNPLRVVTKHKGFIRLAMQHGASLVPVFSFGEAQLLDNIRMPDIQRWFIKKLGFGYPHFPYGRLWMPVPRRRPITLVVGRPIQVNKNLNPTPAEVDEVHRIYYSALKDMFDRHKAECGFPDATLDFVSN